MGNLLNKRTGSIHANAVDGTRRALCDLSVPAPASWVDVDAATVTCEDCQFRIDRAKAEAFGDYDPAGLLPYDIVRVATVLNAALWEWRARDRDHISITEFHILLDQLAGELYPTDSHRQSHFLSLVLDMKGAMR